MHAADPMPLTRRPYFWIGFVALSALCAVAAWRMFPLACPVLTRDLRMDRAAAIRAARQLAAENKWGPAGTARDVAWFGGDGHAQAFVELEGGGKEMFTTLVSEGLYVPYQWGVRLFREGETNQTTVRFRPDGTPNGFGETLRQDAPGATLTPEAAREIAERTARAAPWKLALDPFSPAESSQLTRPGGRIDHTFVYERRDRTPGEGRLRLRLVVSGDRLTELTHFLHVPEAFNRRYAQMRSKNDTIASAAAITMGLLYGVGGMGIGIFALLRRRAVLWRPALICAGVFAGLQLLGGINAWPLVWTGYDTALSGSTFVTERQVSLVTGALGMGALLFLSFLAAEGLTRRAFPAQLQFWRLWSAPAGASIPVLGQTLAGFLIAPLHLLYVLVFYYVAVRWLGWWTPTDALIEPNTLAHFWPWLTPLARAAQAGFWEETLFRAIPLAGAALIGERLGRRRAWIIAGMIVQAVVFAAAHANYPGQPSYSRLVELFVPSLMFGALYLKFGLLPGILAHFAYDVILMALPLFASSAAGIWIDRAVVILLSLLPVWIVLWRRRRTAAAAAELPVGFRNCDWEPPTAAPSEASRPPWSLAAASIPPWLWRGTLILAGVSALAWIGAAEFQRLAPPLAIDRVEAERVTRKALADLGAKLPAGAVARVTITGRPAGDLYVWREAGTDTYKSLLGTYLAPPRWRVQFVTYTGDVAERAEEWNCGSRAQFVGETSV